MMVWTLQIQSILEQFSSYIEIQVERKLVPNAHSLFDFSILLVFTFQNF
jgi:hypothetical protein